MKTSSVWEHNNSVKNWESVRKWLNGYDVEIIDPIQFSLAEQTEKIANSAIVISLWGGGSMFNFLAPTGAVEIIIGSWNIERDSLYTKETDKDVKCPDFDRGVHNSYSHVTTVVYCISEGKQSSGWDPVTLEKEKFMNAFDIAKGIVVSNLKISLPI